MNGRLTPTRVALAHWFLIGAVCPVFAYMIHLKWPNSFIRYVKSVAFSLVNLPCPDLRHVLAFLSSSAVR